MNMTVRNILAVVGGIVIGSVVNMSLVMASASVVLPPEGVDVSSGESLRASIHLFEPRHFLFPFLAHALGTFAGALTAYLIAGSRPALFAYVIGGFFLLGGIAAAAMIRGPVWFIVVDLVIAYFPMAWVATMLGRRLRTT